MPKLLFDSWESLLRVAVSSVLAYAGIVFLLRVSGKRTLSKMNAFDLVVTVALGSLLSAVILNKDVPIADGLLAFAMVILLQFAVTWLSVRSRTFRGFIKARPALLFYEGEYLEETMKRERVIHDEILAALRKEGLMSLDDVKAVVLETDSSITVVQNKEGAESTTLKSVEGPPGLTPEANL